MLGLRFCARALSSCGERGPLFIAVRGPLTIAASLVAEHRLQTRRLSSCGSGAQLLRGMWDPPRPGLEPVSPALAGGLPTTAPPGKPKKLYSFKVTVNMTFFSSFGQHTFSISLFIYVILHWWIATSFNNWCIRSHNFLHSFVFFLIKLFIYLFLAALGHRCCSRAFSSCGERGLLFLAVRGLLTAVASLVAEHGL